MEVSQIPFHSNELAFLICNSNVKHELSSSEYPTRHYQCNKALQLLGLENYRDATINDLQKLQNSPDPLLRRARHIITEIQRTVISAQALRNGDYSKVKYINYLKLFINNYLFIIDG